MKKLKKKKSSKKLDSQKKWSMGQTIAAVIGGIALVSGGTVLGVYLTGGFKERVINPESIAFSYDDGLFNNDQLEISGVEDFELTITTPTEKVTAKKVYLSFAGVDYSKADGYISNRIIQVPEEVEIGKPFKVTLLKQTFSYDTDGDGSRDLVFEGIAGGISTLYATSENNEAKKDSIKIAVDTPVYEIDNYFTDMSGNRIEKVGADREFKIGTTFYPEASRYLYGDVTREKIVLYGISTGANFITDTTYDSSFGATFKTGKEIVNDIQIRSYAFTSAKAQSEMLEQLNSTDTDDARYTSLYDKLAGDGENHATNLFQVKMASASISSFEVARSNDLSLEYGEKTPLYVNSVVGQNLGVLIKSTEDETLTYMLENVALQFVKSDGTEVDLDSQLKVVGRDVKTVDGKTLVLPYNDMSNKNNCYWDITSSLSQDITINVYLVIEEAGEEYHLFKAGDLVSTKAFTLKTVEREDEVPTFIGQDEETFVVPQETITLEVSESAIPQLINLRDYIVIPEGNRYKDVQFYVKGENLSNVIQSGSLGGASGDWTKVIGDNITVYGAGSFQVKFETIKPDGSVAKACEGIKTFVCQESLSANSIGESKVLPVEKLRQVDLDKNITAHITKAEYDYIYVKFTINEASKNVFKDEYDAGRISLVVKASENDITQSFSISSIWQNGTLQYTLTLVDDIANVNGINITNFTLVYSKNSGENTLSWQTPTTSNLIIYTPKTASIVIDQDDKTITYEQTLANDGLHASLKLYETLSALTQDSITITDQFGRTDTLAGKWEFVIESDTDNIINLSAQTFGVKGSGSATILIQSSVIGKDGDYLTADNKSEDTFMITITANAVGVDHLKYQINKRTDNDAKEKSNSLASVTVEKYGVEKAEFTMANLVEYYLDESQEYTCVSFKFSASYFLGLTETQIVDLYGANGMLQVWTTEEGSYVEFDSNADAETIKAALENKKIYYIGVAKHFGKDHTIKLDISDTYGVINTSFTFKILSNIEVGVADYTSNITGFEGIYTAVGTPITNSLNYVQNINDEITWTSIYGGIFYVAYDNSSAKYKVYSTEQASYIATITNGKIIFADFWDEAEKKYTISLSDDNSYGRNLEITFNVLRNIKISLTEENGEGKVYYIDASGDDAQKFSTYITVKRVNGTLFSGDITYAPAGTYLTNNEGAIKIKDNKITFEYNKQVLYENIQVSIDGIAIDSITLPISMYTSGLYSTLAGAVKTSDNTTTGALQKIISNSGVETTYILLDSANGMQMGWQISGTNISISGNSQCYSYQSATAFTLKTQSSTLAGIDVKTLAGLDKYYLHFKVKVSDVTVTVYAPLIISKVGEEPVKYGNLATNSPAYTLYYSLIRGNKLLDLLGGETNIAQISAGATQDLAFSNSEPTKGIMKFVPNQTIGYDSIGSELLQNAGKLINQDMVIKIDGSGTNPQVSLNHIDQTYGNVYLPIYWQVGDVTFYYLVIVTPDVTVKGPVYAYDGDGEYITCEKGGEKTIDFSEKYDENTLHFGETRFSVVNKDNDAVSVTPEYYIKSINYGGQTYISSSQWTSLANFKIDGSKVTIIPQTNDPMSIVIGLRVTKEGEKIIGGEKEYVVVLNQNTTSYLVEIETPAQGTLEKDESGNYTWTVKNYTTDNKGGGDRDIVINLLDASDSLLSTMVYEKLQVTLVQDGDIIGWDYNAKATQKTFENQKIGVMNRVSDTITANTLKLRLKTYIDTTQTLKFALHTKYGYLCTLTVNITPNVEVSLTEAYKKAELQGGEDYGANLGDMFEVKYNGVGFNWNPSDDEVDRWDKTSVTEDITSFNIKNYFDDVDVKANITIKIEEYEKDASGNYVDIGGGVYNQITDVSFTFTQDFTIKANATITTESQDTPHKILAGAETEYLVNNFVSGNNATTSTYYDIVIAPDSVEVKLSKTTIDNDTLTLEPAYVSEVTKATLKITVKLDSGQTRTFDFTVDIYPAAEVKVNYPKPDGTNALEVEYFKGSEWSSIFAFFGEGPAYGGGDNNKKSDHRAYIQNKQLISEQWNDSSTADLPSSDDDLSIKVIQMSNIKMTIGAFASYYTVAKDVDISGMSGAFTISRGSSGGKSTATFEIIYKGAVAYYNIEVLDELFTVETNFQTNNTQSGEYDNTPVTYEELYLDKVNATDLFAQYRMLKITTASVTEGTYRFVFKDNNDNYYISDNVDIIENDRGRVMTYDLGVNMQAIGENFTLYGVYDANDFVDSTKWTINATTNILESQDAKTKTKDALDLLTSYNSMFNFSTASTVGRFELYYAGIKVAETNYASHIQSFSLANNNVTLETVGMQLALQFTKTGHPYSFYYYYKPILDIDVDAAATTSRRSIEATVNSECTSIVQRFGIHHASTGELLTSSEFNENRNLVYTLIDMETNTTDYNTFNDKTNHVYQNYDFKYRTSETNGNKFYLQIEVGRTNSADGVYDFAYLPLGAKNEGDYVLTKLTYKAGAFTKDFYIVIYIQPDYIVKYNDIENGVETNGVLSNSQSPIVISETSDDKYTQFSLLKSTKYSSGFLSVTHEYGLNQGSEIANTFTYTMTGDVGEYNIQANVVSKLHTDPTTWIPSMISDDDKTAVRPALTWPVSGKDGTKSAATAVVFGEQKYFITGVDSYGYKVALYFNLSSGGSLPKQASTTPITIKEGENVAITSRYETLTITEGTKETGASTTPIIITSSVEDPTTTDTNLTLVELEGIEAYGFSEGVSTYMGWNSTENKYKANGGYELNKAQEKYLSPPQIKYVTLVGVTFQDENGKDVFANGLSNPSGASFNAKENCYSKIYTSSDLQNGYSGCTYISPTTTGNNYSFQMPELNTDIYGSGTTANVTMYLKLEYNDDSNTEYTSVPISLNVIRQVVIEENEVNALPDGYAQFNIGTSGTNAIFTATSTINDIIQDTLEINVPANGYITFELTYNNETTNTKTITISNVGYNYAKTYYRSISEIIGKNVEQNKSFNVKVTGGSAGFRYKSTNETGKEGLNEGFKVLSENDTWMNIKIVSIVNICERIQIDHISQLNDYGYMTQEKYYVVKVDSSYYRATKTWYVSGLLYDIEHKTSDEIDYTLSYNTSSSVTTSYKTWMSATMSLKRLNSVVNGEVNSSPYSWSDMLTDPYDVFFNRLYFKVRESESSGNASVDFTTGNVTIKPDFNENNYVTIEIYQGVTGTMSNVNEDNVEEYCRLMTTVRLGRKSAGITVTGGSKIESITATSEATSLLNETTYKGTCNLNDSICFGGTLVVMMPSGGARCILQISAGGKSTEVAVQSNSSAYVQTIDLCEVLGVNLTGGSRVSVSILEWEDFDNVDKLILSYNNSEKTIDLSTFTPGGEPYRLQFQA